jgi:hypothetical protein
VAVEVLERSEDALLAMDKCGGHLGAAKLLMGHSGVPGVDCCVEAERVAAVRAIEDALGVLCEVEEVDATPMAAAGDRAARLSRRQPKRIPCCSLFACVVVDHLIGVLFHSKFHG